jgi:hypothetical protein
LWLFAQPENSLRLSLMAESFVLRYLLVDDEYRKLSATSTKEKTPRETGATSNSLFG